MLGSWFIPIFAGTPGIPEIIGNISGSQKEQIESLLAKLEFTGEVTAGQGKQIEEISAGLSFLLSINSLQEKQVEELIGKLEFISSITNNQKNQIEEIEGSLVFTGNIESNQKKQVEIILEIITQIYTGVVQSIQKKQTESVYVNVVIEILKKALRERVSFLSSFMLIQQEGDFLDSEVSSEELEIKMNDAVVYDKRDNDLEVELLRRGVVYPLSTVSRVEVKVGEIKIDSSFDRGKISWSAITNKITLKLGHCGIPLGKHLVTIIIYDAAHINGFVWGKDSWQLTVETA